MPSSLQRCARCHIDVDRDAVRCPQCLRKTTLKDPKAKSEPLRTPWEAPRPPAHVAVRLGVLLATEVAFGSIVWLLFANEGWLDAHGLWLGASVAAGGLVLLPLRVVLQGLEEELSAARAARHYALAMGVVLAVAAGFFAAFAVAVQIAGDMVYAGVIAIVLTLMGVLGGPIAFEVIRGRMPPAALRAMLARNATIMGLILLIVAVVFLKSQSAAGEKKTLVIPSDPKALLDPMDIADVEVSSARVRDPDGLTLHLYADAGDLERTLLKLRVEAATAVAELRADPSASGKVQLWLPTRFDSPAATQALREQAAVLNQPATRAETASGKAIHFDVAFGELPPRR